MTQDSALDPPTPRVLQPVVAHFADVIVDRAPPVQARLRRSTPPSSPSPAHAPAPPAEPPSATSGEPCPPAAEARFASTDESWFHHGTLAPAERTTAPPRLRGDHITHQQLLVAAAVTIGSTVTLGVALGALVASLG